MAVTSKITLDSVKVYVENILHIHFLRSNFIGLQSWGYEQESLFYIDIILVGAPIHCEYQKKELWVKILSELDRLR